MNLLFSAILSLNFESFIAGILIPGTFFFILYGMVPFCFVKPEYFKYFQNIIQIKNEIKVEMNIYIYISTSKLLT